MAEWLYEAGIGERRAALVESDAIVEIAVERDDDGLPVGSVIDARLTEIVVPGRRGRATLPDGAEGQVEPMPREWTQGSMVRGAVTREAVPERDAIKRVKLRPADGEALAAGATLRKRIGATEMPVIEVTAYGPDRLEAVGWSEALDAAERGIARFEGGTLRFFATPAMTLVDVDGWLSPVELAVAAASEAARAIRRWGIGGSIGIDFPTVEGKAARHAVTDAFDAALPPPFDRTALNGFGFIQVVRPLLRASLIERLQGDPVASAAIALMRRAERSGLIGATRIVAHPAVIAHLAVRPEWTDRLTRQLGGTVALQADPALAFCAGYAARA